MRAVVVGGSGFIGGAIVAELLRRGDEVVILDEGSRRLPVAMLDQGVEVLQASIVDREALVAGFEGADEVYHLAGMLGTSELDDLVVKAVEVNVIGALNVFDAALEAGVPRVFYASKPNVWLNTYSITKHASEQFAELYNENSELHVASLRYFNAFGPRQKLFPIRKMLPLFAALARRGLPLEVYGDGQQTVDMLFTDDLAHLTVDYTRMAPKGPAADCGSGFEMTVLDVARDINSWFGNRAGITHLPMRRGETEGTRLVADTTAMLDHVGGHEFVAWEPALDATLQWYADLDDEAIDKALAFYGALLVTQA